MKRGMVDMAGECGERVRPVKEQKWSQMPSRKITSTPQGWCGTFGTFVCPLHSGVDDFPLSSTWQHSSHDKAVVVLQGGMLQGPYCLCRLYECSYGLVFTTDGHSDCNQMIFRAHIWYLPYCENPRPARRKQCYPHKQKCHGSVRMDGPRRGLLRV